MALIKYRDGVQLVDEIVQEFKVISSSTITVGTNQYPQTANVNRPTKIYKNYALVFNNKSGQTISSVEMQGITNTDNTPLPNLLNGQPIRLRLASPSPTGSTGTTGTIDCTSEETNPFLIGSVRFQFNLAAAPTSGTIDWALIGY
jgi:hypothetical protein